MTTNFTHLINGYFNLKQFNLLLLFYFFSCLLIPTTVSSQNFFCNNQYRDADGDGAGDPLVIIKSCLPVEGYVANKLDCDDTNPTINFLFNCRAIATDLEVFANQTMVEGNCGFFSDDPTNLAKLFVGTNEIELTFHNPPEFPYLMVELEDDSGNILQTKPCGCSNTMTFSVTPNTKYHLFVWIIEDGRPHTLGQRFTTPSLLAPGTDCDDGDSNTINDVIQADGCTCQGDALICEITGPDNACVGFATSLQGSGTPAATNPWVSSNRSIAIMTNTGHIQGKRVGSVTVTYTDHLGCTATKVVNIRAKPIITGASAVCKNGTVTLNGSGTPAATTPWTSSNTTIATVDNNGLVRGIRTGTVTINYRDNFTCRSVAKNMTVTIPLSAGNGGSYDICKTPFRTLNLYNFLSGESAGGTWSLVAGSSVGFNQGAGTFTTSTNSLTSTFRYTVSNACGTDTEEVELKIRSEATYYKDADADGFSSGESQTTCFPSSDYYLKSALNQSHPRWDQDCNDNDPTIHPNVLDFNCTDGDKNCDGQECDGNPCGLVGDSDGDNVCDAEDCAPNDPNFPKPFGTPCNDGDITTEDDKILVDGCTCAGTVNPCLLDTDGDGITDCDDNCPNVPNPSQMDDNNNGMGNECDTNLPCPTSLSITASETIICKGESVQLDVLEKLANYTWDNGGNTASIMITPTRTRTYSVFATNDESCQVTGQITIQVRDREDPNCEQCLGNGAEKRAELCQTATQSVQYNKIKHQYYEVVSEDTDLGSLRPFDILEGQLKKEDTQVEKYYNPVDKFTQVISYKNSEEIGADWMRKPGTVVMDMSGSKLFGCDGSYLNEISFDPENVALFEETYAADDVDIIYDEPFPLINLQNYQELLNAGFNVFGFFPFSIIWNDTMRIEVNATELTVTEYLFDENDKIKFERYRKWLEDPNTASPTIIPLADRKYILYNTIEREYKILNNGTCVRMVKEEQIKAFIPNFCSANVQEDIVATARSKEENPITRPFISAGKDLKAFPNPATHQVTLNIPANYLGSEVHIEIISLLGKVVWTKDFRYEGTLENIPINTLAPGTYLFSVSNKHQQSTIKFIKQ